MANISSAHGTGTFEGNWTERDRGLFTAFLAQTLGSWGYGFQVITCVDTGDDVVCANNPVYGSGTGLIGEGGFSWAGSGRWSMQSTLEAFESSSAQELKGKTFLLKITGELYDRMTANELSVHLSFADEEGGCDFLYEMEGELVPTICKDSFIVTLKFRETSYTEHERTRTNLKKLDFYEEYELNASDVFEYLKSEKPKGWQKITEVDVVAYLEPRPHEYNVEEVAEELLAA